MSYAVAQVRTVRPLPRWVMYAAIGQFVIAALFGMAMLIGIAIGHLPLDTYDNRIIQQGNIAGYVILWVALLWISVCLLSAGLGGTRMARMRSGSLLVGRAIWVWMFVVGVPCALIGAGIESNVWHDLRSGPATMRGTVTAASSDDEQKKDSHGNYYTVTTYHLTIGGLTFNSSVGDMADIFKRATVGRCATVSYGRYSHELVDLTACPTR
jgi:hypothetical protein